ncbi:UNVERIFIED_CONTAM: hypothetical protein K2H54_031536, partial [Gekko kuhli]
DSSRPPSCSPSCSSNCCSDQAQLASPPCRGQLNSGSWEGRKEGRKVARRNVRLTPPPRLVAVRNGTYLELMGSCTIVKEDGRGSNSLTMRSSKQLSFGPRTIASVDPRVHQ